MALWTGVGQISHVEWAGPSGVEEWERLVAVETVENHLLLKRPVRDPLSRAIGGTHGLDEPHEQQAG